VADLSFGDGGARDALQCVAHGHVTSSWWAYLQGDDPFDGFHKIAAADDDTRLSDVIYLNVRGRRV